MSTGFLVTFFGLLLGILARTALPWLRKVQAGRVRGFDRRYLHSALASAAVGLILALVLFPKFEAVPESDAFEAFFKLFCLAFGFGFGWNALVNEGAAWASRPGPIDAGRSDGRPSAR
ncbi:MAG TPA: hypothetical protein PLP83_02030 [Candidatus Aminicenantes bacterium]|nr:hypothetical protein [Candidatus Aminicenantes bacterium]